MCLSSSWRASFSLEPFKALAGFPVWTFPILGIGALVYLMTAMLEDAVGYLRCINVTLDKLLKKNLSVQE